MTKSQNLWGGRFSQEADPSFTTFNNSFAFDRRLFAVDIRASVAHCNALAAAGVKILPGRFLDFLDPWGNRVEIVSYDNIQFTKAPNVLRGMGLSHLPKNERAMKELIDKGMALN